MSAAVATLPKAGRSIVTVGAIDDLIGWVVNSSVEELTWRMSEIGEVAQWVRAQKAATELRVKAVRLEMIALRKVAQGGLSRKIAGAAQLRACAEWLATLTDDEFAVVLEEIDGAKSPISLYREDKAQRDALDARLNPQTQSRARSAVESPWNEVGADCDRRSRVENAAAVLLESLIESGEPFSIVEAGDALADALGLSDSVRIEPSLAEGMREIVRSAIRSTGPVTRWQDLAIPRVLTVINDHEKHQRVPATAALLWHLEAHVNEVERAARRAQMKYEALNRTLNFLVGVATNRPYAEMADLEEPEASAVRECRIADLVDESLRRGWTLDRLISESSPGVVL